MYKFTSKEIAQRFVQLLSAELVSKKVTVVKCPVETLPIDDVLRATHIRHVDASELQTMSIEELSAKHLVNVAALMADDIAAHASGIFTMILPLPHGAWSTFERAGELGFRLTDGYDIDTDETIIRFDVSYAKAN